MLLARSRPDPLALLKVQANDEHPAVRLEAVRAASFFQDARRRRASRRTVAEASAGSVPRLHRRSDDEDAERRLGSERRRRRRAGGAPNTTATALPDLSAAAMRRDLRDKGVQTITIGTIPEQMLFDVRWFVVEAGKPVQVVLTNSDAMPHNLVIGQPGSVKTIGDRGGDDAAAGRSERARLHPRQPAGACRRRGSSSAASRTRIKFTAPPKPGEYNFLCTFPGH